MLMLKKSFQLLTLIVLILSTCQISAANATLGKDFLLKRASGDALTIDVDSLDADEINELLALMTDAEVRAELARFLDGTDPQETGNTLDEAFAVRLINGLQSLSIRLESEWENVSSSLGNASTEYKNMLRNLTDNQGWPAIARGFGLFVVMIAFAGFIEWLINQSTSSLRSRLASERSEKSIKNLFNGCITLLFSLVGLLIFALVAYGVSLLFFERYDPLRVLTTAWLFTVTITRLAQILLDVLVPGSDEKALLTLTAEDGIKICRIATIAIFVIAFGFFHNSFFVILGISEYLHRFVTLFGGMIVFVFLIIAVWSLRYRIADVWLSNIRKQGNLDSEALVKAWHIPATFILCLTSFLWMLNIILGESTGSKAASAGLLSLVFLFIGRMIFNNLELKRNTITTEEKKFEIGGHDLKVPRLGYSVLLIIIALAFYAEASGLGLSEFLSTENGERLLGATVNVTITVILAWLVWEMIRSAIDRYLPEEALEEPTLEFDGEGGEAAPATRAETLLPLLRRFLQFVLVVLVVLTLLASLGVNIGPLLAGAGVVGLAVGFGAQKLVQDVISGIFFLVDDAFRTGEYIETAGMRGTVEKISVRSLRLRHHLGPVQTVPYSEMATVKNHSRDYIIMKLRFRLPYDTDIEKVRKIIKKCGQEMIAHPELGPGFLAPLKSQGVLEMEDSAMVMRMKFTAKPGEQWVIRREAYRRVRDALRAQGIEFAHKQVTVHIPSDITAEERKKALGAATIASEEVAGSKSESTDIR